LKYSSLFWAANFPEWWEILHIGNAITFAKGCHKAAWTSLVTGFPGNEQTGLWLPNANAIAISVPIAFFAPFL
jgi:hypothetical protein